LICRLSSNGLCDAEMTTPASARIDDVMNAMHGVGKGALRNQMKSRQRADAGGERGPNR